jgi:hypothetical protein
MYVGRGRVLIQTIVTALLLLAVSPVTAPFLTFDLKDLLGDSTAPGVALVQPKTSHDEPVSTVATAAVCQVFRAVTTAVTAPAVDGVNRSIAFQTPLRI